MASAQDHIEVKRGTGLISLFVRHPTAPNLLMAILILAGIASILKLNRQFFPTFDVPVITVSVAWPGATAEDVETNILDLLEPELRFLDAVNEVTSYSREGVATIALEFASDADMQKAQADVEQAVARITTLPEDAETPVITRAAFFDRVAKISVSGPFEEAVLKRYAKQLRDGLLAAGIDRVTLTGARDEEIWIKIREADLRRLGLTLAQVAARVRENTQDQPAGRLEGRVDTQLRGRSDRKTPEAIGNIEIKSTSTGEKVFLKDIAIINTRFERDGKIGLVRGEQAIALAVERAITADTLKTMAKMNAYLDKTLPSLPKTLNVQVYDVSGKLVEGRLSILVSNGLQGLLLVLVTLFLFLNARVAFWVATGIPIAVLATLGVMLATGQSINMVSMFALIMMLGIIVDDAIVVGEHAATLEEQGHSRLLSAENGATRMIAPVTAAMLTTVAAFMPILFIRDRIGDIMAGIPYVVIAAIIASVIECFLVLPGHLRHGKPDPKGPGLIRRSFDAGFNGLRDYIFMPIVKVAYNWRYTTLAILVALLILSVGALAGGRLKFVFFPTLEPENISASVQFAPGTPRSEQIKALKRLEDAMFDAQTRLLAQANAGKPPEPIAQRRVNSIDVPPDNGAPASTPPSDGPAVKLPDLNQSIDVLQGLWDGLKRATGFGPLAVEKREPPIVEATFTTLGSAGRATGDNLAQIDVQLSPSEVRSVRTVQIIKAWRRAAPKIAGVERLAITGRRGGPPGRDVDVRLQNAPVETLKRASEELKRILTGFPGVSGIDDDLPYGKQELVFELTPRGTALGFTGQSVGQQVRTAFEGAIATRFARGDEEITVRVKRLQQDGGLSDLNQLYLDGPNNVRVPFNEVVSIKPRRTFSIIQRRDGIRTVGVTADIDDKVTTTEEVIARLEKEIMPALAARYNITYRYKGKAEERAKSFADLGFGATLSLALIYIILAWVFASYWKPFAVMAIIPFGFVGAVVGHYTMGFNLTIISMVGLLGLSGILVNDSIVLVSRMGERMKAGQDVALAAIEASRDRFRAVLLTSLTTIGGLLPLTFETSRQAQFLIPMAITVVYGLAAATVLVLILVPALMGIGNDIGRFIDGTAGRFWRFTYGRSGGSPPAPTSGGSTPAPAPAE
ncbi:MAG: efflux RND transporter permease subunit [Pseudomonadota bacterium]